MGIPASPKAYFTLPRDRQSSHRHAERTISPESGRHLLSLLSFDSITFHVIRNPLNVSLLAKPGMFHPVSRPLQPGIRFFQHPIPARHQLALRLAYPKKATGPGSHVAQVDPMDDLGVPSTPVVLWFRAGS